MSKLFILTSSYLWNLIYMVRGKKRTRAHSNTYDQSYLWQIRFENRPIEIRSVVFCSHRLQGKNAQKNCIIHMTIYIYICFFICQFKLMMTYYSIFSIELYFIWDSLENVKTFIVIILINNSFFLFTDHQLEITFSFTLSFFLRNSQTCLCWSWNRFYSFFFFTLGIIYFLSRR